MSEFQKEAIQHELKTESQLMEDTLQEIKDSYREFNINLDMKNAYILRGLLSSWIRHEDKYQLLHKIYQVSKSLNSSASSSIESSKSKVESSNSYTLWYSEVSASLRSKPY